jgi:uncharacterized damage-inducible protein DinB
MSVALDLLRFIGYSNYERAKWKAWVAADPRRLTIPFQSGGRFETLWNLFDHMFLVERRHLSRLQGATPPEATGIEPGDWQALFDYADLVRADLYRYAEGLSPEEGEQTISFTVPSGSFTMTRRKLAVHILLHEVRHLAQIAYAARIAGEQPPGEHDYFFWPEG